MGEYILRCAKKKEMDQWFKLFTVALNANFLSAAMMKRMTDHRDTHNKRPPTTPPPMVPSAAKRESKKYKERVSKIQNIGGLNSASFTLNGAKSPSNQESKPYSVSITKPENVKPTMNELLNGLNSPTSTKIICRRLKRLKMSMSNKKVFDLIMLSKRMRIKKMKRMTMEILMKKIGKQ